MPIDVIDNILDHLSLLERLTVRNVSRNLRDLIDKRTTTNSVKQIKFIIDSSHNTFWVIVDNVYTYYKERNERKTVQYHWNHYNSSLDTYQKGHSLSIKGPDAMKNALKHLAYYLKNPKLKLKWLSIGVADDAYEYGHVNWDNVSKCYKKLLPLLLSLEHQISTEEFSYSYVSEYFFLVALKSFKPGVLEVIHGEAYWYRNEDYDLMGEIVETEQWKQAKRFISWGNMPAIIEGVAHFEEFTMSWSDTEPESVIRLKEVLSASKTFKKGGLSIFNRDEWVRHRQHGVERFVEALGPRIFRYPDNPRKWSYPIPDTNEFLDFQDDLDSGFSIERTT